MLEIKDRPKREWEDFKVERYKGRRAFVTRGGEVASPALE